MQSWALVGIGLLWNTKLGFGGDWAFIECKAGLWWGLGFYGIQSLVLV